jgi:hypothetical protein
MWASYYPARFFIMQESRSDRSTHQFFLTEERMKEGFSIPSPPITILFINDTITAGVVINIRSTMD